MGNALNANLKSCCSNDYYQTKKEVDWSDNQLNPPREDDRSQHKKVTKIVAAGNSIDLPFKKPESLNFEYDRKPQTRTVDRIKYLEEIASRAPKLILKVFSLFPCRQNPFCVFKVVNSTVLSKGSTIKINAQGAENGLRGKKDGVTYFGCKKKSKPMNENFDTKEIINDVIIKNKDPETNDRHRGRHFQIDFCVESNTYKIRDLGIGFGAFTKIDQPIILKDNNLLSMGSSFLIINFSEERRDPTGYSGFQNSSDAEKKSQLKNGSPINEAGGAQANSLGEDRANRQSVAGAPDIIIKIFGGPNYGEVYQFNAGVTPVIKIGRMPDCEIKIEDNLLSKYQSTIKYISTSGWTLLDGFNNKGSTNSNWLYLNDDFEIHNNMIFKANHTLFQAQIEQ